GHAARAGLFVGSSSWLQFEQKRRCRGGRTVEPGRSGFGENRRTCRRESGRRAAVTCDAGTAAEGERSGTCLLRSRIAVDPGSGGYGTRRRSCGRRGAGGFRGAAFERDGSTAEDPVPDGRARFQCQLAAATRRSFV